MNIAREIQERYACLYAREFPAQALLRLRPELRAEACAVMAGEPPREQVCAFNAAAAKLGVARGMTRVEIDTIPQVVARPRSSAVEVSARSALLECAGTFSPRVHDGTADSSFLCVIDITGTEALFGPSKKLAGKLLEAAARLGFATSVAVSANFHAAIALAQGMHGFHHSCIVAAGEEGGALAGLPVRALTLSDEQAETLAQWGIGTLGDLAALPEAALTARMGQAGKRLRLLARGELPHLFVPLEAAFELRERIEFDAPVDILESLLFVVGTMLEQLALRAGARALALAEVNVELSLEGGATHRRSVRPALPTVDRQLWIKLIHLDLEAHPPDASILAIELQALPGATGKVQMGLFSPQTPEAGRLDVTLARLRALVGDHAVGRAVLDDTHQADAFHMEAFTVPTGRPSPAAAPPTTKPGPSRAAVRQLRPAESISVHLRDGRPEIFFFRGERFNVDRAYGPWLLSGAWWTSTRWRQEQWDVIARTGATTLCCLLARDAVRSRWTLAGLYD